MNYNYGNTVRRMDKIQTQEVSTSTVNRVLFELADEITQELYNQDTESSLEESVLKAIQQRFK